MGVTSNHRLYPLVTDSESDIRINKLARITFAMIFSPKEFWDIRVVDRKVDGEGATTYSPLRYHPSSQVILLRPRNDTGGLAPSGDRGTGRANIAHINTYSSSVFAELSNFFEVTVDRTNAITEVY
jgi:hypothetical protein